MRFTAVFLLALLACSHIIAEDFSINLQVYRSEILSRVNQERYSRGLSPLAANADLESIAQQWSENLSAKSALKHRSASELISFLKQYGWRSMNENLHGSPLAITPQGCINSWMKSDIHRKNLLDNRMSLVGFGVAKGKDGFVYVVMNAAQPASR